MDKEEIKRRLAERIDEDDEFASSVQEALEAKDKHWLSTLLEQALGFLKEALVGVAIRILQNLMKG